MSKRSGGSQASSAASPARVLALKATAMVRERDSFAKQTLAKLLQDARLPKEEKDFAWLLVTGVVSSQGTLDQVIDASLRSPSDIKPDVRDALRISTYELIFLDKPAYAVVDQGVELVRSVAPRAANLANAVLHKIARSAGDFPWGDPDADAGALARQHAHPEWLVRQVIQDRGVDFVRSFLEAGAATAPLFVSGNPFAGTRDWAFDAARFDQDAFDARFLEQSRALDPRIEAYGVSGCYRSMQADAFLSKASAGDGLVASHRAVVADAASQLVARLATPVAGEDFLEIGAGRGSKTILLQTSCLRAHGGLARITSIDNLPFKTQVLRKRMDAAGVPQVQVLTADATQCEFEQRYVGCLIDAPCSGTGTLRRHPEQRWRLDPSEIAGMAELGYALLENCSRAIRPGGFLVYATCSVMKAENEDVVERFLASPTGASFRIESLEAELPAQFAGQATSQGFLQAMPSPQGHDGHFAARLRRL